MSARLFKTIRKVPTKVAPPTLWATFVANNWVEIRESKDPPTHEQSVAPIDMVGRGDTGRLDTLGRRITGKTKKKAKLIVQSWEGGKCLGTISYNECARLLGNVTFLALSHSRYSGDRGHDNKPIKLSTDDVTNVKAFLKDRFKKTNDVVDCHPRATEWYNTVTRQWEFDER